MKRYFPWELVVLVLIGIALIASGSIGYQIIGRMDVRINRWHDSVLWDEVLFGAVFIVGALIRLGTLVYSTRER